MKKPLFIFLLACAAICSFAVSPKRGKERLRELAVMPTMTMQYAVQLDPLTTIADINETAEDSERIDRLRQQIKGNAEDIALQLSLGKLLSRGEDTNASKMCFQKAEKLARTKSELNSADGLVLSQLGDALWQQGEIAEAERVCRKATKLSPKKWQCWTQLGKVLDHKARKLVWPKDGGDYLTLASLLTSGREDLHVPGESIKTAEKVLREAKEHFDRAVQLAPKDAEALLQRALHYSDAELTETIIRLHRKEIEDLSNIWKALTPEKATADIKLASTLADSPRLVHLAAVFEWANKASVSDQPFSLASLPDSTRQIINQAISRLEEFSQRSDKKIAAAGYESLGMVKVMITGQRKEGASDLKKAVELDPARNQAWDVLSVSCDPAESIEVGERRLNHKDSARNRFIFAKMLSKLEQWDKAAAQAEIALQRQPDYIGAHLILLAINLRQSSDPKMLEAAANRLRKMGSQFKQAPASGDIEEPVKAWWLNAAIYNALHDDLAEAKSMIGEVLNKYPEDETAKEIQQNLQ